MHLYLFVEIVASLPIDTLPEVITGCIAHSNKCGAPQAQPTHSGLVGHDNDLYED